MKKGSRPLQSQCPTFQLKEALHTGIRIAQQQVFAREYSALKKKEKIANSFSLIKLSPYMDEAGVIRVGGRLDRSTLNQDMKHPMILPSLHPFSTAVIRYYHQTFMHASTERTLVELRSKY